MIKACTYLNQVETSREGIGVRLELALESEGLKISSSWHRTFIPSEIDPYAQIELVNSHISSMQPGWPNISDDDIEFIIKCHAVCSQAPTAS